MRAINDEPDDEEGQGENGGRAHHIVHPIVAAKFTTETTTDVTGNQRRNTVQDDRVRVNGATVARFKRATQRQNQYTGAQGQKLRPAAQNGA